MRINGISTSRLHIFQTYSKLRQTSIPFPPLHSVFSILNVNQICLYMIFKLHVESEQILKFNIENRDKTFPSNLDEQPQVDSQPAGAPNLASLNQCPGCN